MHFNTINTGILDLSEMAIRANKALRGLLGQIVCQESSGGRVRGGNKERGWREQMCTNTHKTNTHRSTYRAGETAVYMCTYTSHTGDGRALNYPQFL